MVRSATVLGHWHLLVDEFSTASLDFYKSVEARLAERKVPDTTTTQVEWKEGGLLSAKRVYLRVGRSRLTFDLCAAPFGTSYFFSWWLAEQALQFSALYGCLVVVGLPVTLVISTAMFGLFNGFLVFLGACAAGVFLLKESIRAGGQIIEETILSMPAIGAIYHRFFKPVTYFSVDTRLMFQESVHRAVLDAIEELRSAHGLRALSPDEARPTMRDLVR